MLICGPAPVGELAGGAEPDAGLALVDPVGPGVMVVGLVASMAAVDHDF
jgi:hypothetical protein